MLFQLSWVMSSRTKTILDNVSSLKNLSMEDETKSRLRIKQWKASQPICTLWCSVTQSTKPSVCVHTVTRGSQRCILIILQFSADRHDLPVAKHAQLAREAVSLPLRWQTKPLVVEKWFSHQSLWPNRFTLTIKPTTAATICLMFHQVIQTQRNEDLRMSHNK